MTSKPIDFSAWKRETGNLPWGAQRAMHDVVSLAAEGKTSLVHGANFSDGKPCLVNSIAPMIAQDVNAVSPCGLYPNLVSAFDTVCSEMARRGLGEKPNLVSPLMAEFLLRNFGDLKTVEEAEHEAAVERLRDDVTAPYREPSDEEFGDYLLTMASEPEVTETDIESEMESYADRGDS